MESWERDDYPIIAKSGKEILTYSQGRGQDGFSISVVQMTVVEAGNKLYQRMRAYALALVQSVQRGSKNSCVFEFPAFLPPTNPGLPMHSPSALTEHMSPN